MKNKYYRYNIPPESVIALFGMSIEERTPSYRTPPCVTKDMSDPTYGSPAPSAIFLPQYLCQFQVYVRCTNTTGISYAGVILMPLHEYKAAKSHWLRCLISMLCIKILFKMMPDRRR